MRFKHETIDLGYDDLLCVTKPTGRMYTTPPSAGGRKSYPSITTVLGHQKKGAIEAWRKRVGEEEANKITYRASSRGTAVHELIERYLNNEESYSTNCMPNVIESFNDLKPFLDGRLGNIYGQELPLFSHHLGVAGRVDCIADFDGKLSILDFKTSAKPKKRAWVEPYFMQECFYAIALFERTGLRAHQLVTLMTIDDNPPQVYIEQMDDWVEPLKEVIKDYKNT